MPNTGLFCNVHSQKGEEVEAVGVASSAFGPISGAYCIECLDNKRDVYQWMVAGLQGIQLKKMEDIRPDLHPYVLGTLKFAEKTFEDLVSDVRKAEEDYNAYMLGEPD